MAVPQSMQTWVVGLLTYNVHPYILFVETQLLEKAYRIVGNFCMVQNFAVFADGAATVK